MGATRLETLDGMRGLCALIVVFYHCGYALNTPAFPGHGWLSVDMFFVLSGFVIARTHEERLRLGYGFAAFMGARAKRLLPIQTIGTLVVAASLLPLYLHGGSGILPFGGAVVAALFLIPISWTPVEHLFPTWRGHFPVNSPLWSLQGEWIINAAYGRFLYAWTIPALLGLVGVSAVYVLAIAFTTAGWAAPATGMGRASFGFVLGTIVFRVHQSAGFRRLPHVSPVIIYALWFFICCIPQWGRFPILHVLVASLISAMFVAVLVNNERPMGRVSAYLGRLSYPLYASHFAVVNLILLGWPGNQRHNPIWAVPMLLIALVLAVGVDRLSGSRWIQQSYGARLFRRPACQTASPD